MTQRPETSDTIVAIATAPGRGALGTLRLSGERARSIAQCLFRPWKPDDAFPAPRHATSGTAIVPLNQSARNRERDHSREKAPKERAGASEAIDHGVLVFFPADDSPTGEDLVEITLHGSPTILRRLLEAALSAGGRAAVPGEFSYRALLHGRLDATQAEAIDDLVQARTDHQARVAHRQQTGALSQAVEPTRALLVEQQARLEGSIEFSATEVEDFLDRRALRAAMDGARDALDGLLAGAARGVRLQRGARVVFAGPVNAGKSSIFNKLLEFDRAIVSPHPGTTRDVIEAEVEWDGLPVTLVDTAGDRTEGGRHPVEREGQRRGEAARAEADLVVWITAVDEPVAPPDAIEGAAPRLLVVNKIDLEGADLDSGSSSVESRAASVHGGDMRGEICPDLVKTDSPPDQESQAAGSIPEPAVRKRWLCVSAKAGTGLADLKRKALEMLAPGWEKGEAPLVTRLRQKVCLEQAVDALDEAGDLIDSGAGEELIAIPVDRALERLGELTGRGGLDEIYDRIFSTFCIGK